MTHKQKLFLPLFSLAFLFLTASPLYGQGKKDAAFGQQKKEEKAIIGNVGEIQGNKLFVEDKGNKKTTETLIDSNTEIVGKNKPTNLSQIKRRDLVAIISTDSATASPGGSIKKAIKVFVDDASPSATAKRQAVQGVITGINGGIITIAHQVHHDRTTNISTTAQTTITIKGSVGIPTVADLQIGMRVVAVGDLNEDNTIVANRIHVIPGKGLGLPKVNSSSPSASLSITPPPATGSATPSATPTATSSGTPTATGSASQ